MITNTAIFLLALLVAWLLTWPLMWLSHFWQTGQPVRADGPATHLAKAGTPTLGGVGFLAAISLLALIFIDFDLHPVYLAILLIIISFAAIGLADDLIKLHQRRNQGLTFWQKIIAQSIVAASFALFLIWQGYNLQVTGWLQCWGLQNPYLYQLMTIFLVVGSANATNLTDGLNGLLAGTAALAFIALAFLAQKLLLPEATTLALICAGASVSFLYFNFPRAKIFMGDVGSLAIGAGLAGLALVIHQELRFAIIGGVFVAEALSVICQVASYKLFQRRIFKMAPLHHHFELSGLSELKVVLAFWTLALLLGIIGVWL